MHAQNAFFYARTDGHVVEAEAEGIPKLNRVSPLTFIIEPIRSINLFTFMISS
jgi:hypothetical protein